MSFCADDISTSIDDFAAAAKKSHEPIALDLETTGLVPFVAEPVWISWAAGSKVGAIPILHRNPFQNSPVDQIKQILRDIHSRSNATVIWHNGAFDLTVLVAKGWLTIEEINSRSLFDTMLASYILNPVKNNEGGKHSLKFLYREIKGQFDPDQPTYDSVAKGRDFSDIPFDEAKWYSGFDAWATLKVYRRLSEELLVKENQDLFHYFTNIEMPHLLTTIEIAATGMRLRKQKSLPEGLWSIKDLYREYDSTLSKIYELAGHTFNFTSPRSLRWALFKKSGINPLGRGIKSGEFAIDKWTLADIFSALERQRDKKVERTEDNKKLIAWTLYAKLILENIKKHEEFYNGTNSVTGLIHPQMRQTTSSGRYSCRSPNTLSMSTTSGIKEHLIPREGSAFVIADFSQIDLRVIANETAVIDAKSKMAKAVNDGVDLHINTLSIVDPETKLFKIKKIHYKNDQPDFYEKIDGAKIQVSGSPDLTAKITDIKKKRSSIAKPLNFGISYGLGPKGLLSNLNNTEKFQELIFKNLKNGLDEMQWLQTLSDQAIKGNGNFTAEMAADFLTQFHSEYPEIPTFQEKIEREDLQKTGATVNIFGRRCRAEGVQYLLSDSAVIDVYLGSGDWFRVHCRGIAFDKVSFSCLITKVFALEVGTDTQDRKLRNETPLFELNLDQLDLASTQFELKNICEEAWRNSICINAESGMWGGEDFFERVTITAPVSKSSPRELSNEPLMPFVCFTHSQIKFIQSGPLATFFRYPGYDALRRKLISYRVSSTSMDICKIAMIEFRKAVQQWFKRGKLKCIPRIVNCIHDEIAVECHSKDTELVKLILDRRMSFKGFVYEKYLAQGRELRVEIRADVGSSDISYAKAKPA